MKIAAIVGARPNFVKIAPIMAALRERSEARTTLIHTGQHYDVRMSEAFFANLEIPAPDINLDVRSGTAAAQIASALDGALLYQTLEGRVAARTRELQDAKEQLERSRDALLESQRRLSDIVEFLPEATLVVDR